MALCFFGCKKHIKDSIEINSAFDVGFLRTIPSEGWSGELKFKAVRDWTIVVDDTKASRWLSVAPSCGHANDTFTTITVAKNTGYDSRAATITIISGSIQRKLAVVQKQFDAVIGEDKTFELTYEADNLSIPVKHNTPYNVSILEGTNWVSEGSTKGLETTNLVFSYDENTTIKPRTAKIEISGA